MPRPPIGPLGEGICRTPFCHSDFADNRDPHVHENKGFLAAAFTEAAEQPPWHKQMSFRSLGARR